MYKKPPTQYQFKKGQSGNPKGRPKNEDIVLIELMLDFTKLLLQAHKNDKVAKEKVKIINEIIS